MIIVGHAFTEHDHRLLVWEAETELNSLSQRDVAGY